MRIWTPGEDWGSYLSWNEQIQFDWEILLAAGCKFCVHKSDQEELSPNGNYSTIKNIKVAREKGIPLNGVYVWFFPHVKQQYWVDRYTASIEREQPDFIEVDAEQVSYLGDDGAYHVPPPQQVADNLLELCEKLKNRFPNLPFLLYTRPDYITKNATPCLPYINKYEYHMAGWPDWGTDPYELPLADRYAGKMKQVLAYTKPPPTKWINVITDGFEPPAIIDTNGNKSITRIWQSSSRVIPTYAGRTIYADHQYDTNFYQGTFEEMLVWAKKATTGGQVTVPPEIITGSPLPPIIPPPQEGAVMPLVHNKAVPYNQRAWILQVGKNQKVKNASYGTTWVDAVLLETGGTYFYNEGGSCKAIPESYDQTNVNIRCKEIRAIPNMIPIALYKLDPGAMLRATWLYTRPELPLKENEITRSVITVLHDGAWTWDDILTGKGRWNKFGAIAFEMTSTIGYAGDVIGQDWQNRVIKTVTNHIKLLQQNNYMPNIPVILYTNSNWLQQYNTGDFEQFLIANKNWLWLWLEGEKERYPKSTATFAGLQPIFEAAYPLLESYSPTYIPDGYHQRVLAVKVAGETQKISWLLDASGNPSLVSAHLWNNNNVNLFEFFGEPLVLEPPVTPPVSGSTTPPPVPPTPPPTTGSTTGTTDPEVKSMLREILDLLKWLINKITSIFK